MDITVTASVVVVVASIVVSAIVSCGCVLVCMRPLIERAVEARLEHIENEPGGALGV